MRILYTVVAVCFTTAVAFTCTGVKQSVPFSPSRKDVGVCDPTLSDANTDIGIASGGMQVVDTIIEAVSDIFIPVPGLGKAISTAFNGILGGVSGVLGDLDSCPAGTDYGPALADIQKKLGKINDSILQLTAMAQKFLNEVANLLFNGNITTYQQTLYWLSEYYRMYGDELTNPNFNARNGTVLAQLKSFCLDSQSNPLHWLMNLNVLLQSVDIVTLNSWSLPDVTQLTQKVMSIATGLASMEGVCLGLTVGESERPLLINETLCQITFISNVFVNASTTIQQKFHIAASGDSPLATDIQQQILNYQIDGKDPLYNASKGLYRYVAAKYSFCDWLVAVVDTKRYSDYYIGMGDVAGIGWMIGYGVLNVTDDRTVMFGWYNSQQMNRTNICVANLLDGYVCDTSKSSSYCGQQFIRKLQMFCHTKQPFLVFRAPDEHAPLEGSDNMAESFDKATAASIRIAVPSTFANSPNFKKSLPRKLTSVGKRKG